MENTAEYILEPAEIEEAFIKSKKIRYNKKTILARSAFFVAAAGLFVYYSYIEPQKQTHKFMILICAVFSVLAWVIPRWNLKKAVNTAYSGKKIIVNLSESLLEIKSEMNSGWEISFSQCAAMETDRLFIFYPDKTRVFILPKRALSGEQISLLSAQI